jgi:Novel STAND NTPase 1
MAPTSPAPRPLTTSTWSNQWRVSPARCRCSPISSPTCGSACASVATAPSVCRTAARLSRSGRRCRSVPISSLRSTRTRWTPAVHAASRPRAAPGRAGRTRWERDAKQGADPAVDAEWALVEQLAGPDWRLIVTGEKDGKATAEVAHEILFKTWPTLKRWLEDERNVLVARRIGRVEEGVR